MPVPCSVAAAAPNDSTATYPKFTSIRPRPGRIVARSVLSLDVAGLLSLGRCRPRRLGAGASARSGSASTAADAAATTGRMAAVIQTRDGWVVTRQRLRQRRADRQPGVVGESDVAHRAASPLGAREPEQPQHGRRHHHRLAGADRKRLTIRTGSEDECRDRASGHHERAGDHDPRRTEVVGEPSSERASGRAGQRRRPDREADEHRAAAERMDVVRQDPEHRAERGVAEDRGAEDDQVLG